MSIKKKLDLFLKIYDYRIDNVKYLEKDDDLKLLLMEIDKFKAHDLILLSADCLGTEREQLNFWIDSIMLKKVRIISVMDQIVVRPIKYYLNSHEKTLFVSAAIQKNAKNQEQRIGNLYKDSNRKNERIGIYCRVSTREQTLGYSIENQKSKNLMYLQLFDYEPEHIEFYIDEGQSAASLNRKNMKRMLDDVVNGNLDEIIIYKLDRLTRNVLNTYELIQLFLDNQVNLVAVLDNLDIRTANGRMVVGILAIFAQWERETIIERTNDGQLQMAAEGKYPKAGCPLGYIKDDDKYLSIDENLIDLIKDIFKWAKGGSTFIEIRNRAKAVYDIDIHHKRLRSIIFEDGYYGEFKYKDFVFTDIVPAIVSKSDAMEARKILGKREISYGKEQNKFYYRNKVKCSCCGEITFGVPTYKRDKRYYYYYCKQCNKRINQDVIISMTLFDMLAHNVNTDKEDIFTKESARVKRIEQKMKQLTRNYANDLIAEDAYNLAIKELEIKVKDIKSQFGNIKIINGMTWSELSDAEKRSIVEKNILTMTVDLDKKRVTNIEYESTKK